MSPGPEQRTEVGDLLRQAAEHLVVERGSQARCDLQPALWVLTELIEAPCGAPTELRNLIRRRLLELAFMDQGGDTTVDPHFQSQLDHQVELVVTVLQQHQQHTGPNAPSLIANRAPQLPS